MAKSIYGKKIGMTHIFDDHGKMVPVTVVLAGPCTVTRVKTAEKDGYSAIQVGLDEQKPKRVSKPKLGQFTKANLKAYRVLREIRTENGDTYAVGQTLGAEVLEGTQWVDVVGVSKGKGYQGVIKRHKFRGGDHSHGSMFYRAPGSIGASSDPSRVLKGVRLPGHMGDDQVTAIRLKLVKVDTQRNVLLIRGAVPGANRSLVMVKASRRGGKS
jgi:large subunit ribosomal protein L3